MNKKINFVEFISKVNRIKGMIIELTKYSIEQNYDELDKRATDNYDYILKFLTDENIDALIDCQRNIYENHITPLDNLGCALLDKIEEIEKLTDKALNYFTEKDGVPKNIVAFDLRNQVLSTLYSQLEKLKSSDLLSSFNVLKHLSGHNKTLIILGPNGSGKTSLANYLKRTDSHVKVIPASKPIKANGHIPSMYSATIDEFNTELYAPNAALGDSILQKLIIGICTENDNIARDCYNGRGKKRDSQYKKIKTIFEEFFEVRLDDSEFANKRINGIKEGSPFPFNSMSDGERAAFFYIATVLVAPQNSFVIVDEPENHLNPAIYNKIWDKLIDERSDCQFIFITHTMDFISARTNYELLKIKMFNYPSEFEFEFLGENLDKINNDLLVEIVGSRKPVLFCEGVKNDFDYKIYEILFGKYYTVIPVGNCKTVIESVEACNRYSQVFSIQTAVGIIDSDLKDKNERKKLQSKEVYVLECNEIEMLLVDKDIFASVLHRVYEKEEKFENYKKEFFKLFDSEKNRIIKRIVKTKIDEKISKSRINDHDNNTKEEINNDLIGIVNEINVYALWDECEKKIDEIVKSEDYDGALKYCCLEHGEVIGGICNKYVKDYSRVAIGRLQDDSELRNIITERYLPDLYVE